MRANCKPDSRDSRPLLGDVGREVHKCVPLARPWFALGCKRFAGTGGRWTPLASFEQPNNRANE